MASKEIILQDIKVESDFELHNEDCDILEFTKTRFMANIIISKSTINHLLINADTKVKGNIVFKNCTFKDSAIIKKITSLGSIDFIDCQFRKSFKIYSSKVKGNVNFFDTQIHGDLLIQSLFSKTLNIDEVSAKNIRLESISDSIIEKISIVNTTSEHLMNITEIHNTTSFIIKKCNIGFLLSIQKLINRGNLKIEINDCYMKNLKIHNNDSNKKFSINITDCITDKLQITKCKGVGLIDLNNTSSSGITKISTISSDMKIDISTLTTSELLIDSKFYLPILSNSEQSQLLLDSVSQKISTLQILEKYFHQNGSIMLQDKMTYLLRDLEFKNNIYFKLSSQISSKTQYYIGKYLFGWGIDLKQLFSSFIFVTLLFSFIYLGLMGQCNELAFTFKQVKYSGYLAPFELSIFYMLGFYSEITISCINYFVGLIQHIIGLAYLTLIIGVGIRKLVN